MSGGKEAQRRVFLRRRLLALLSVTLAIVVPVATIGVLAGGDGDASEVAREAQRDEAAERLEAERRAERLERAVDRAMARSPVLRRGPEGERTIALTFDDGPGRETMAILDTLKRFDAPATFFAIGGISDAHAPLIRRAVAEGHAIENHTVGHPDMTRLSRREQAREIDLQTRAIVAMGAPRPRFFRPPYNRYDEETMALLRKRGMLLALWSIDPGDWVRPGPEALVHGILEEAHPGGIVLLHDGGGDRAQTLAALPEIIRGLRQRGYRLVTLPELLLAEDRPAGEGPAPAGTTTQP